MSDTHRGTINNIASFVSLYFTIMYVFLFLNNLKKNLIMLFFVRTQRDCVVVYTNMSQEMC